MARKDRNLRDRDLKVEKCKLCGNYPKEIPEDSLGYICSHCLMDTSNYSRYKNNQKIRTPLRSEVFPGDKIITLNGKIYEIVSFNYSMKEDKYYNCKDLSILDPEVYNNVIIADYMFYKKIDDAEVEKFLNKINAKGKISFDKKKKSCFDCRRYNAEDGICKKYEKELLQVQVSAENCEFYKNRRNK